MFLNDLFSIVSLNATSDTLSAEIKIDVNHAIFEGHFPGSPVTPGVVQLQMVKEILENHLQKNLRMKTMRTCKFLRIINPIVTPVIHFEIKFAEGEYLDVIASGNDGENVYFKAQLSYL